MRSTPTRWILPRGRVSEQIGFIRVESIGGGDIVIEGRPSLEMENVYPENSFAEIAEFCRWRNVSLSEYVELNEGPEIWDFLHMVWETMCKSIEDGLQATGVLPGPLRLERKAKMLYENVLADEIPQVQELRLDLFLCLCYLRAECRQRHHRHRAHLWQLRCAAARAAVYAGQI